MKIKYCYIIIVLLILIVFASYQHSRRNVFIENKVHRQNLESKKTSLDIVPASVEVKKKKPAQNASNTKKPEFQNSNDYFELALSLLNDAENGDPESQYFLFKVLHECTLTSESSANFTLLTYQRIGVAVNLEHIKQLENEAMKCSGFNNNFNHFYEKSSYEWLKLSADNKYPKAMAMYAKEAIQTLNNELTFMPTTDVTFKMASEMLLQSLISGEAEVYMEIAQVVENIQDQTAWGLLACRNGYNCKDKNFNLQRAIIIMNCINLKQDPDCYEKTDYYSFLRSAMNENAYKSAIARSLEIEKKLSSGNYQGIGLDKYLEYIKE